MAASVSVFMGCASDGDWCNIVSRSTRGEKSPLFPESRLILAREIELARAQDCDGTPADDTSVRSWLFKEIVSHLDRLPLYPYVIVFSRTSIAVVLTTE